MPVLIQFDFTTSSPQQAKLIDDATPFNDGVMTKAQAAKLAGLTPGGSGGFNVVKKIANYTAKYQDLVAANPALGSFTVKLPTVASVSGTNNSIVVKVQSSSGNFVTVTPAAGDTIDGQAGSQTLYARESIYLVSDGGTDWMIVS